MTALAPQSVFAGQFRIVHLLSQGGFGSVYVAEQAPTGHQRALKVMHAELAADPRARERFIQEAQISAHIESEHVAQVIAAGIDQETGIPWLAMELLHGKDLAGHIASRGRIPAGETLEILKQLSHALVAAHRQGIVHRDLKPENVFVADSRRTDATFTVKVLDFGIARWLRENSSAASSAVLGSPLWMAPEQFDTVSNVSAATDVWAVGHLAFMMLTGRSYWRAASSMSLPALIAEVTGAPAVSASQRAAELGVSGSLPPNFDAWFARCTHRDVSQRFRDAAELAAAAVTAFEERPVAATVATPAIPLPFPNVPTTPQGSMPRTQALDMSAMPFAPVTPPAGSMAWNPAPSASAPSASGAFAPAGGPFPGSGSGPIWGMPPEQGGMRATTATPPPKRSGALVGVGIAVALLVVGGVAAAGIMYTMSCDDGAHSSNGHCCRDGTDWDTARRACVASGPPTASAQPTPEPPEPPVQPVPVQPTPVQPPPVQPTTPTEPTNPMPTEPSEPATPSTTAPEAVNACVGTWSGGLNLGTRNPGQMSLTVRGAEGSCGQWSESWSATGARCVYTLRQCEASGEGAIVAKGYSSSARCVRSVSVSMRCTAQSMRFRETTRAGSDTGTLSRR